MFTGMELLRDRRSAPHRRGDIGFTLIELLVVVIIVALLVAIAVPVFAKQRQRAQTATLQSDLRSAALTINTYFADGGTWDELRQRGSVTYQLRMAGTGANQWNDVAGLPPVTTTPGTSMVVSFVPAPRTGWYRAHAEGEFCLISRRDGSQFTGGNGVKSNLLYYDVVLGGVRTIQQIAEAEEAGREPSCGGDARAWINAGRP